jgi:purine-cytosine permease-like protein
MQTVYNITQVGDRKEDRSSRNTQYMWAMVIRMLCFAAAIITTGILQLILLLASLILPWVAVVIANAGRENGYKENNMPLEKPNSLES